MCQPKAKGGRRCAAHTRPAFKKAVDAVRSASSRQDRIEATIAGAEAVARHAATRSGRWEVNDLMKESLKTEDGQLAGMMVSAMSRANVLEEISAAVAAANAARRNEQVTAVATPSWDPGTPNTDVGTHWSVAQGGDRWHAGGCGAFAIAMVERWPHLKIACEMYRDHGEESVAHAWAYDPDSSKRFHIFGAEHWTPTERPDYDPDSHRVLLDQSPDDVRGLFRSNSCNEDNVFDAMEVACEMFDPDYVADDEYDRRHLYFY